MQVAYTVSARFEDHKTAKEWLQWLMDGHVAEVLATGAIAAEVVELDGPGPCFEVRYRFPTREVFERYEREFAPQLRTEGLRRFPSTKGIQYQRTVGVIHALWGELKRGDS
jgi:Domain of unknown function (DUF4286)